ncbi:NACHT, LRR and PYD domains-containing protein 1a-like [Hyperolius riggenbachi]|uniref:NACHT, LRR and PYD domains-containing protein 1a-like n=1 Tax=Hyperolius riggenbachi TaxID=752182 RepID=UPI0035A2ED4F
MASESLHWRLFVSPVQGFGYNFPIALLCLSAQEFCSQSSCTKIIREAARAGGRLGEESSAESIIIAETSSPTSQPQPTKQPQDLRPARVHPTSPGQGSECEIEEGYMSCNICAQAEDSADVVTPEMSGNMYRLVLRTIGLFCCSETGIKFQVTRPVIIEYELDSWCDYSDLLDNQIKAYETISPLFNITTIGEPYSVSAVYLPHYLCLQGFDGDRSWIQCVHFKDGNLVLETPTTIVPYYVVLENPSFSPIGLLLQSWRLLEDKILNSIPYHGMVLLFSKVIGSNVQEHKDYAINLYLMPHSRPLANEVETYVERYGFKRVFKHPQTKSLYNKKNYSVKVSRSAVVEPDDLLFESRFPSEPYPCSEIIIRDTEFMENVFFSVIPENGKDSEKVWKAYVSRGEILELPANLDGSSPAPRTNIHFIDQHRTDLIRKIGHIEPVLDDLCSANLLTHEQYDLVRSQTTSQEKMRTLYSIIHSWGTDDKDEVYTALCTHNLPVIKSLEKRSINTRQIVPRSRDNLTTHVEDAYSNWRDDAKVTRLPELPMGPQKGPRGCRGTSQATGK